MALAEEMAGGRWPRWRRGHRWLIQRRTRSCSWRRQARRGSRPPNLDDWCRSAKVKDRRESVVDAPELFGTQVPGQLPEA